MLRLSRPTRPVTLSRRPRAAALALAAGAVALGGFAAGCEDSVTAAERRANAAADRAVFTVQTAPAETSRGLAEAAGDADAPPAAKARATDLLATAEFNEAAALASTAAEKQVLAQAYAADLARLGQQVALGNAIASGYQQFDPAQPAGEGPAPLPALDERIKGVQTGDTWSPAGLGETVKIPTLEAVRAEIERLTAQVGEKDARSAELDRQRGELLRQADDLSQQSERSTGQASVDAFKRAADMRKQAGDLATEQEVVDATAEPLRADLALAQAREKELSAAVDALQDQRTATTEGWQSVQAQIAAIREVGQGILGGSEGVASPAADADPAASSPTTVAALAGRLAAVTAEMNDAADGAAQKFASSAARYADAGRSAASYVTETSARTASLADASASPLTSAAKSYDPRPYALRQSLAELERARVLTGRAASIAAARAAATALAEASQAGGYGDLPDALNPEALTAELESTLTSADEAYEAALAPLENLTGTGQSSATSAAKSVKVYALYGQALLARTQAAAGVGDASDRRAEQLLNAAASAAVEARADNPNLQLPAELADRAPAPEAEPGAEATPDAAPDAEPTDAPAAEVTEDQMSAPADAPASEDDGNK